MLQRTVVFPAADERLALQSKLSKTDDPAIITTDINKKRETGELYGARFVASGRKSSYEN